jgi:hypothetical protein
MLGHSPVFVCRRALLLCRGRFVRLGLLAEEQGIIFAKKKKRRPHGPVTLDGIYKGQHAVQDVGSLWIVMDIVRVDPICNVECVTALNLAGDYLAFDEKEAVIQNQAA